MDIETFAELFLILFMLTFLFEFLVVCTIVVVTWTSHLRGLFAAVQQGLEMQRDAFLVLSVAVLCSVANSAPQTEQVSDWLCPPPSSNPGDTTLCDEPKCEQDIDCISESHSSSDNDTASDRGCCFNGCVHTCTKKLEPPIAFDWLEEFRQNEEGKTEETPEKIEVAPLRHHAKTAPHAITTLPGGCVLTQRQYEELEGFRKHSHVEKCFCDKGGVSCEVSRKNMSLSDAA